MKAIWTNCTRALKIPLIGGKRGRVEDEPISTGDKKAKVGGTRKIKAETGMQVNGKLYYTNTYTDTSRISC